MNLLGKTFEFCAQRFARKKSIVACVAFDNTIQAVGNPVIWQLDL